MKEKLGPEIFTLKQKTVVSRKGAQFNPIQSLSLLPSTTLRVCDVGHEHNCNTYDVVRHVRPRTSDVGGRVSLAEEIHPAPLWGTCLVIFFDFVIDEY